MDRARIANAALYGGVLVVALAAGAWAILREDPASTPIAAPAPRPRAQSAEDERPIAAPELPEVPDLRTEPPPARPSGEADPRIAQLAAEMRSVNRARELLAERHPAEALSVLEEHRASYADGVLREEREAFAIEALVELERRSEAERRYYDFRRAYPHSDFARRLSELMR